MSENEDTTKQILENLTDREILIELAKKVDSLSNKVAKLEKSNNIQFEAIREGIVYNSAKFDRLEATVYGVRADVANLRADVKELTEEIHQIKKEPAI